MQTVATQKGQIVIPAALRKKYGIRKGTRIAVSDREGSILLQPITPAYVRSLRGLLKGANSLEELMAERAWEKEREDGGKSPRVR